MRCLSLLTITLIVFCGCGAANQDSGDGTQQSPSASSAGGKQQPSLSEVPADHQGPWLGELTLSGAEVSPLRVDFSIRVLSRASDFKVADDSTLWFCLGTPSDAASFRVVLERELKGDSLAPDLPSIIKGELAAQSVNYLSHISAYNVAGEGVAEEATRGLSGSGFTAFACRGLKQEEDGLCSAIVLAPKRDYSGEKITIHAPASQGDLETSYPASEAPVSVLLMESSGRLSNERRAVVNFKTGKIVRLLADEK